MIETIGYATHSSATPLVPFSFQRRDPGPQDVQLEILYCGVCHSDLHTARNEWTNTTYPVVPGHEIVGRVVKTGAEVRRFKEGDLAGVGCLVGSCRQCESCKAGLEQYCELEAVYTYNGVDKHLGGMTYGGYSRTIVVDEYFVLRLPENLSLPAVAPLLCAGITTYSPLRHWKVQKGQNVGVVGLGGLGHMAVKLANAFGAHVTLFTTSAHKKDDARRLGAHDIVISTDQAEMEKRVRSYDFILDTVSAEHDINAYLNLLKRDAALVLVGAPEKPLALAAFSIVPARRELSGSMIGGLPETQEMLNFCGEHGITADIEIIPIQKINEAYERMLRSDVKYRFVIDMASLKR
ncbi:MAG: NAD(P)-dependent alcohol dehydrogenase [Candidatus Korobacteraceae bacterium]